MASDNVQLAALLPSLLIGCSTVVIASVCKWKVDLVRAREVCNLAESPLSSSLEAHLLLGYWSVVLMPLSCVTLLMVLAWRPRKLAKRVIDIAIVVAFGLIMTRLLVHSRSGGEFTDQDHPWAAAAADCDSNTTRPLFDDTYCRARAAALCSSRDHTHELLGMFGGPDLDFQLLGVTCRLETTDRFENVFYGCQFAHAMAADMELVEKSSLRFLANVQLLDLTENALTSAAVDIWCGKYLLRASGVTDATPTEASSHLAPSRALAGLFGVVLCEWRARRQSDAQLLSTSWVISLLMVWSWCKFRLLSKPSDGEPAVAFSRDDTERDPVCEDQQLDEAVGILATVADDAEGDNIRANLVRMPCPQVSEDDEFHFVQC